MEIKNRLNEQKLPLEGDKRSPSDWADLTDHDENFAEEFGKIINNKDIPEAVATFTPEVFDDTYLTNKSRPRCLDTAGSEGQWI